MYKEYIKGDLHNQLLEKKAKLDRYVKEINSFYEEFLKSNSQYKIYVEDFVGSLYETEIELSNAIGKISNGEMEAAFNNMWAEIMNYLENGRWPKIKDKLLPECEDDPRVVFSGGEDSHMFLTFEYMNKRITAMIWFCFICEYTDEYMGDTFNPENNTGDITHIEDTKDEITVEIDDYCNDSTDAIIKDKFFGIFGNLCSEGDCNRNEIVRIEARSEEVMDQFLAVLDKIENEIL